MNKPRGIVCISPVEVCATPVQEEPFKPKKPLASNARRSPGLQRKEVSALHLWESALDLQF